MWPGRAADHSPPSSAAVMEEYSYTSTHPMSHTEPVTGKLYLLPGNMYVMYLKSSTLFPYKLFSNSFGALFGP